MKKIFDCEVLLEEFLKVRFNNENTKLLKVILEPKTFNIETSLEELRKNLTKYENEIAFYEIHIEKDILIEKIEYKRRELIFYSQGSLKDIFQNEELKKFLGVSIFEEKVDISSFKNKLIENGIRVKKNNAIPYDTHSSFKIQGEKEYIIITNPVIYEKTKLKEKIILFNKLLIKDKEKTNKV